MLIKTQNRNQTILYTSLEDMISKDNPVRIIDYLIEAIIKKSPEDYRYKGETAVGRPAYPVSVMLKLFIYGCINRINSSRRLEIESTRNIELMWLLGNLMPDFKTISDFRRDNKEIINKCSKDVKTFLKYNGLISGEVVSIDGTKLKANANRNMLSEREILTRIASLEEDIEFYINQIDMVDEQEDIESLTIISLQTEVEDLKNKITEKEAEVTKLKTALERLKTDNKNYVSLTDMDCSKQKSRDGIIPGYNVQMACDTKHGFIVAEEVTSESNDINQIKPMVEEICKEIEQRPLTALADTGYSNLDDIQSIESQGTDCYIPLQKEQIRNPDITFKYDKINDKYTCSEGKDLILKSKNKKYRKSRINVYVGESCQRCHLKDECMNSKVGKHISRYWNQDYRDHHREKMSTAIANYMSKIRKSTIEAIFGTAKVWLGKIPLLTRGKPNVKTEIKILSISFNIKKLIQLFSFDEIKYMIDRFLGLDCQKTSYFLFIFDLFAKFSALFSIKYIKKLFQYKTKFNYSIPILLPIN